MRIKKMDMEAVDKPQKPQKNIQDYVIKPFLAHSRF
jgi:hypothetical protein